MTLVVDASVTLARIFTEERTLPVQKILDRLIDEQAFVPAIWRLGLPRATLDQDLRAAGDAAGVILLGA